MKILKSRSFNVEALFKTFFLAGFGFYFGLSYFTGEALAYVNPKMLPFIIFGSGFMFLLAVINAFDIFKIPRNKTRLSTYSLFALALALALIFPPATIRSGDLKGRQMEMGRTQGEERKQQEEGRRMGQGLGGDEVEFFDLEESPEVLLADLEDATDYIQLENGRIILDENNFYNWLFVIYRDVEEYTGLEVELTGFVFRDEDYEQDEFVVARFVMVCCIADMQQAGLLCRYPESQELETDSWVHVRGTLKQDYFQGVKVPVIVPKEIRPVEEPDIPYVYPAPSRR